MSNRLKHIYVAAILTLLYAPITVMIAQSFNASRYRGHWTGFTLDWYASLLESEEIFDALSNTLSIGLLAATIATVVGLITCIALHGMRRRTRAALMSVANIPMLNADIVTGISLMLLFLAMGLRLGYGSILLAHIVFCLPYVMLCIMPR
ncbi:MAG: ABC transporter permease, partial [Selenomonadaceae bacterium]|nr:ABC transporter permease [Selenomonadaceae bacterium]